MTSQQSDPLTIADLPAALNVMRISMSQRLARARRNTRWFSLKTDILAVLVAAIGTGGATYYVEHGADDFNVSHTVIPIMAGMGALIVYWALLNGIEFVWNLSRAGERIAVEEIERLRAQLGDSVGRERHQNALVALTELQETGAQLFKEADRLFQASPIDNERWEAAISACRDWAPGVQTAIRQHCPEYLGEFESFEIGGGLFEEGNARRGRLAEILRQLRLAAENS